MSPVFKGYSSTNGTESKNGDEVHKRKPAGVEGSFCKIISRKIWLVVLPKKKSVYN